MNAEASLRTAEGRNAYLVTLGDALRPLVDPADIQATAVRLLGQHLAIRRAQYFEVDATGEYVESAGGYAEGAAPHVGRIRLDDFGSYLEETHRGGRTFVVVDTAKDPRISDEDLKAYEVAGLRACVGVPLVKKGRFVAALGVHHDAPRAWSNEEIAIIEETAERVWAAAERARAEAALRQSEARQRRQKEAFEAAMCGAPLEHSL